MQTCHWNSGSHLVWYGAIHCKLSFLPDIFLQERAPALFSYFLFSPIFDLFGAYAIASVQRLV